MTTMLMEKLQTGDVIEIKSGDDVITVLVLLATDDALVLDPCDGATPFETFTKLVVPLSVPVLASFAIFQFLWVWNDLLIALVFLGGEPDVRVVTLALNNLNGSRGQAWHLLTAGAFITMALPLVVFLSLQRYFVRGLTAGSVKG